MSDNNKIITAKSIEDMIADLYKGKNAVKLDEDVYQLATLGSTASKLLCKSLIGNE